MTLQSMNRSPLPVGSCTSEGALLSARSSSESACKSLWGHGDSGCRLMPWILRYRWFHHPSALRNMTCTPIDDHPAVLSPGNRDRRNLHMSSPGMRAERSTLPQHVRRGRKPVEVAWRMLSTFQITGRRLKTVSKLQIRQTPRMWADIEHSCNPRIHPGGIVSPSELRICRPNRVWSGSSKRCLTHVHKDVTMHQL